MHRMIRCASERPLPKVTFGCGVAAGTVLLGGCRSFLRVCSIGLLVDLSNAGRSSYREVAIGKGPSFRRICHRIGALRRACPSCFRRDIIFGDIVRSGDGVRHVLSFFRGRFKQRAVFDRLDGGDIMGGRMCSSVCHDIVKDVTLSTERERLSRGLVCNSPAVSSLACCLRRLSGRIFGSCQAVFCKIGGLSLLPAKDYVPFDHGLFMAIAKGVLTYRRVDRRFTLKQMSRRKIGLGLRRVTRGCGRRCCSGVAPIYGGYCVRGYYNRYVFCAKVRRRGIIYHGCGGCSSFTGCLTAGLGCVRRGP